LWTRNVRHRTQIDLTLDLLSAPSNEFTSVIQDTIKLDVARLVEKAVQGKVKMMISSCCIRVLYQQNKPGTKDPDLRAAIERAKSYERVRCGHLMDSAALNPIDCLTSVLDHKGKGNKYRYCLATQDEHSGFLIICAWP
jgi:U3 small nucleolar RNA-associated protein 23